MKYFINFFIAAGCLLAHFLGLAIALPQFLQPELYITNNGFIKSLIGKFGSKNIPKMSKLWQNIGSAD